MLPAQSRVPQQQATGRAAGTGAGLRIPLRCSCPGCRDVAAYIYGQGDRLVVEIRSRHHGQQHTTCVIVEGAGAVAVLP